MLFFFKQKTAYEMRISDWSSDVCSSDLNLNRWYLRLDFGCGFQAAHVRDFDSPSRRSLGNQRQRLRPSRDRKSVVSGKSVSVRVDLGGRRIIKKKKNSQN